MCYAAIKKTLTKIEAWRVRKPLRLAYMLHIHIQHFKLTRVVSGALAQQRYFTKTQVDFNIWLHFFSFLSFFHSSLSLSLSNSSVFFYLFCHLRYKHDATNIWMKENTKWHLAVFELHFCRFHFIRKVNNGRTALLT